MHLIVFIFVAFVVCQWNNASAEESFCRHTSYGRGVGTILVSLCAPNEQEVASLCYPKCQDGYENIGSNICRKIGCGGLAGATDIGVSCAKPAPYGRGFGYTIFNEAGCIRDHGSCEKWGAMYYPKCQPGYYPFACCICSSNCPSEYTDDGAFCRKPSYGRGVGVSRLGCASGLEYDAGLCYTPCSGDRVGIGPMCWSKCGGRNSVKCGLFCASSSEKCAEITLQIVGSAAGTIENDAKDDLLSPLAQLDTC